MVNDFQTGFRLFLITSVLWQMVNLNKETLKFKIKIDDKNKLMDSPINREDVVAATESMKKSSRSVKDWIYG